MQNKFLSILIIFLTNIILISPVVAENEFDFRITEIEILDDGNKIVGKNRGDISTSNGIIISANSFEYDKTKNILTASGNVIIKDNLKNYKIFSEDITYEKNEEVIFIKGLASAEIKSRYNLKTKNMVFLRNQNILDSKDQTTIKDIQTKTLFNLEKFNMNIENEVLKGEKVLVISNYDLPQNDKLFFENSMFDLKNENFVAKDIEIQLKKNTFDNMENDPRLKGVSLTKENDVTIINKGIFTSCKKDDNCPPWAISANKITHDKNKKLLIYDDALLKVYDIPILYFPKFFHPDPTVKRQSGLLQPRLNNSNTLGSSINIPYYHVIADNKDITVRPTIFDKDVKMFQNEYRQVNENSSLMLDFAYIDNYKSSLSNKKNSISHLFAQFDADLALENFTNSNFFLSIQKVTNDTYLKIFDGNLFKNKLTPDNYDVLNSKAKLTLSNNKFDFIAGFESYENLQLVSSDRYQYILPYYSFDKQIFTEFDKGFINFSSFGSNDLNNTNNLKSRVINDLNFQSLDLMTDYGFKNNYNIYLKNLNTTAKNDSQYKSSPQVELMSILEFNTSIPMIDENENNVNYLTPKISLRFNPGDMKNYSDADRKVSVNNIFEINRLGIDDSFEEGKSLTMGVDFKKTNILDINKFFEAKFATVYREDDENFIPSSSGIDKKNSNFFGSISNNFSEFINVGYDFIIDNDFNTLKYNSLNTTLNFKNLTTEFNFIEENGEFGDANTIENKTKLKFNDENYLTFNSRRNRKISLTEYYDLIYEYKNDCLVAGIKYNKTYYEDRDLKPSENLLFTITLSPLTSFEQKVDK